MAERSVTRKAALVGALTGVSRVLGLVREVLTARLFGTSLAQSAFVVAFTVPNLFRRLFGEGALSAAFVPAFSKALTQESREDAGRMARRVLTLLGFLLSSIVVLGMATTWLLEPHVEVGGRMAHILPLLRIMLPYAVLICLAALCMGMLNVLGDFRTPALAPALLNVVWIGILVGVVPWMPDAIWPRVLVVSWGIVFAGALQFLYQWHALRQRGWRLGPERGGWSDPRVRRVWHQTLPAALGAGVVQINVCIGIALAFRAAKWAPSALTYADRILYLPMGLVATAFGTVLLPTFSRQFAEDDAAGMRTTLRSALSDLALVMVPAAVGLAALATPIVAVLYERGQFHAIDTIRTARALVFYAPGLVVFSIHKVLNPLFYAMHDTRTPMRVSAGSVLLSLALNVASIIALPTEWKHVGIAASTVISSAVASCVLARLAMRRIGSPGWLGVLGTATKALAAAAAMAVVARWTYGVCVATLAGHAGLGVGTSRLAALVAAMAVAAVVYGMALLSLCPTETRRVTQGLVRALRRRLARRAS